ncbi:class I SAM-dependent RNA methyltransferase [Agaribacterium sp. ZY112]|uniref:class I SAM-dependent RNA methyltransferase n=1 Tax=Agaribacterium sp. ZY112 TaxID=3233574 RepID=UPI0035254501
MKIGEVFEAEVIDLTSAGQGVVKHPLGATVFASGVWLGERALFELHSIKGRVGFASLKELLVEADVRRQPPCKYQGHQDGQCGACPWMIVDYKAQLLAKQQRVLTNIHRIDTKAEVHTIWPCGSEFAWRNRVQFKSDGKKLGFVSQGSNTLVDVESCMVLSEDNLSAMQTLRTQLPNSQWQAPSKKQPWSTLDVDENSGAEGVSVNKRLAFQQANTQQNTAMRAWLHNKIKAMGQVETALELFCGSGNFTEAIAAAGVKNIHAVEGSREAIEALACKNIPGVYAEIANLFDETIFESLITEHKNTDVLVLDPPRDGLKQKKLLFPKKPRFKSVFYISCDLATFCRDARAFIDGGYKLIEVQPLDQFPQTPHVEILAYFKSKK